MKYLFLLLSVFFVSIACHQEVKPVKAEEIDQEVSTSEEADFPKALEQVFEAHGGLEQWRNQRTLSYVLARPEKPEIHTTDLWSRYDRIDIENISMGFDGKTWLLDPENQYKGNPEFYHNLMFYFYAMPFVLADDGINYDDTAPLLFEGKQYPGIQITYNSGVGTSPKDEYYLHYNPETYQMEWLGYTVTYRTGEDSDNIKWIRYDNWGKFNDLILPKTISWYEYEGRKIKELRNTVVFDKIEITEKTFAKDFYSKPAEAEYYKKPE